MIDKPRPKHIGLKIKLARVAAKMRIKDVEKKSGISRATISRIERGQVDMRLKDFVAFCQVVGATPNRLLCESEVWEPREVSL
jgi:transcriptional regulator with XRE-family HTH domain